MTAAEATELWKMSATELAEAIIPKSARAGLISASIVSAMISPLAAAAGT